MARLHLVSLLLCATGLYAAGQHNDVLVAFSSLGGKFASNTNILDNICDHSAILVVNHPGVVAQDLYGLAPDSPFTRRVRSAPSKLMETHSFSPIEMTLQLADLCNSQSTVLTVDLPQVIGSGVNRKESLSISISSLLVELESLSESFSSHAVVLLGTTPHPRIPEADPASYPHTIRSFFQPASAVLSIRAAGNGTVTHGGILARYQLLTPGLISALLITFLILLPAFWMGLSALASITSPQRMDVPSDKRGK